MSSSGSACTPRSIPTAAWFTTSTISRSSTTPCTSTRVPRRANGRGSWSAMRTASPPHCAASPRPTAVHCRMKIRRSASCGARKARRPGCAMPRTRCASSWDRPTAFAPAWFAPEPGRRISPKRSRIWDCPPSWPCCRTSSLPSTPRRTPRWAPPDCGSSCARPVAATCASTAPWTIGSIRSVRPRPPRSCWRTTTGCWAPGRWR